MNDKIKIIKQINPDIVKENGHIETFKEQVADFMVGSYNYRNMMVIAVDSGSLSYIESVDSEKPLVINPGKVQRVMFEHSLSYKDIMELDELIEESIFAFDSLTREGSRVLVLDKKDINGDMMIAICKENDKIGRIEINRITSVYGKQQFKNLLERTYEAGKKFYCNEKTKRLIETVGLQLPERVDHALSIINFKGSIYKSQVETLEKAALEMLPQEIKESYKENNGKEDVHKREKEVQLEEEI
ncbi:MAG: hypothetical protein KH297_04745 [Firmicutes bacterium]|nr:hypothetical protein [Bacillota bacterium]